MGSLGLFSRFKVFSLFFSPFGEGGGQEEVTETKELWSSYSPCLVFPPTLTLQPFTTGFFVSQASFLFYVSINFFYFYRD